MALIFGLVRKLILGFFLRYKAVGMNLLRGLLRGSPASDPEQKGATPNPSDLLDEETTESLVAGRSVGEAIKIKKQEGRGVAPSSGFCKLFANY